MPKCLIHTADCNQYEYKNTLLVSYKNRREAMFWAKFASKTTIKGLKPHQSSFGEGEERLFFKYIHSLNSTGLQSRFWFKFWIS